jgi:hypothetical protein
VDENALFDTETREDLSVVSKVYVEASPFDDEGLSY